LNDLGVATGKPICLFAGRFERSYDLSTVIKAARTLRSAGRPDVQFLLCGGGSRLRAYQQLAQNEGNVFFTGWVDAETLQALADVSTIGLSAYADDATQSVPNKPFEYMASSLAIVSSLPGDMQVMLDTHECGVTYKAGSATSLAKQLLQLLSDGEKLAVMQKKGRAAWESHYRSRHLYADFVAHLEGGHTADFGSHLVA
jgi:glycosyltransferase involved in cell wall biosynthesis